MDLHVFRHGHGNEPVSFDFFKRGVRLVIAGHGGGERGFVCPCGDGLNVDPVGFKTRPTARAALAKGLLQGPPRFVCFSANDLNRG